MNTDAFVYHKAEGDYTEIGFLVYLRPWTTNAERSGNRWERQEKVKMWRGFFNTLGEDANLGTVTDAKIDVFLELRGRLQDTAACNPAIKAAIDGLVDAKVFIDDTGEHVKEICFHAPVRAKEDLVLLIVKGKNND